MKPDINPESLSSITFCDFLKNYFTPEYDSNRKPLPQLIIFDHLEELFSSYPERWMEQQKGFFEQVTDSLENNPRLRIVFIIREDHLAQLDSFKSILPEKLRPRFRLDRLRRDQAMLAIKGPIANIVSGYSQDERRHIELEQEKLVNYLLKVKVENSDGGSQQLEGEFIEPTLLQVVCQRWWNERESKGPIKDLEDLTNVDEALEDFYEAAIHDASSKTKIKEQDIRTWCQEKLITSSGTRSIVRRDLEATAGLPNKAVDILEDKYIIRKEERSGVQWYELTHDRLIKPITDSNKG
jgi:hypothetical protein